MPLFTSLNNADRAPTDIVAYRNGAPHSWREWMSEINALRQALQDQPAGRWALFFTDSYAFSIALFALWSTGRVPLLLPDASAHTLERQQPDGFLGDLPADTQKLLAWQPGGNPEPAPVDCAWPLTCATALSTSGSTGDAVTVTKTPEQLLSEVETYVAMWGNQVSDCTFFATVSHQHIYGLLFRVLLPLAIGRPFWSELMPNPRSLLGHARRFDRIVWVASPAQLKRTNIENVGDLPTTNVAMIFSSGGLLEPEPAAAVAAAFPAPAFEVYGSTETGGIAWRQQHPQNAEHNWQRLPVVDIRTNSDGLLEVRSPYTEHQWMTTGDRAALANDQFQLLGRADRIVKLEEKRISLTASEREIDALEAVHEARLVVLHGAREQLAAVCVLSESGLNTLYVEGRNALIKALRGQLLARLEHHSVPRRFRFVSQLPTTTQGKIRAVDLAALFEHEERNVLPVVQSVQIGSSNTPQKQTLSLALTIPHDLDYFAGHFSEFPVVPGVVQLLWVRHFAKLHLQFSGDVNKMSKVKFKAMMQPKEAVTLTLEHDALQGRLAYFFAAGDKQYSSGVLHAQAQEEQH